MRRWVLATSIVLLLACSSALAAAPKQAKHDQDVIRFFINHPKLAHTPAGVRAMWSILDRLSGQIRALQIKRAQPTHLSLWLCIHSGEGSWNANTGNGYYGGLQMTSGWYGGSGHHASDDPPLVQMQAAEQGYAASGYSLSWLRGQWPNTSLRCA